MEARNALACASPRKGALRALRDQPFRRFYVGQTVSASGSFLQQTALAWLVLRETRSATTLGLVLAAGTLPVLVLGPWGGVVVDRVDKRRLLIATQTTFCLLAVALWLAAQRQATSVVVVIAVLVVGGLVQVVDSPARQAFVAQLVPPDDLSSAVSLNGAVVNSARVVGPAVAGVLIATVGTTPCFAVNAGSYVAVIVALLTLHPLTTPVRPGVREAGHSVGGVRQGLRYAASRQQLWLPLTMMALVGLLAFNFTVVLPVLVQRVFHAGGGAYGLLASALGVGAVVGSLGVGFIHHPRRIYLAAACSAFGVSMVGAAFAPNVAVEAVFLLVTGATAFSFVTLCSTTLQLHAGSAYRGRIMALFVYVYIGTTPIGSALIGWITNVASARAALVVGAVACFVAGFVAFLVHTPPHPDDALTDLIATEGLPERTR
jgi:MFS family permease